MPKHKRRSIVVEGETYQWLAASYAVYVWHRKMGRKSWQREQPDDWDIGDEPVTPRDVADFIYREFLHREPPSPTPHRARVHTRKQAILVPKINVNQQRVFALVRERFWFGDDGWLRSDERTVACFTDPEMAKEQASRLNPPYAADMRKTLGLRAWPVSMCDFEKALGDRLPNVGDMFEAGFTLWKSTVVPLYDSVTLHRLVKA